MAKVAERISGPVWVPDPVRAFVPANVKEQTGNVVTIEYTSDARPADSAKLKYDLSKETFPIQPRVEEKGPVVGVSEMTELAKSKGVNDMDELRMLNMATVLENVETLFQSAQSPTPGEGVNTIYSSVGPVLIAMNPFQPLPLYTREWMDAYHNSGSNPMAMKQLGPHAYRTAEEAYQGLKKNKNQAVVICGESGAGKTVTNRKMLEMLCETAKNPNPAKGAVGADPGEITGANELLESFGNATTTRNDNSSRFGKLTSLHFEEAAGMSVCGCSVKHYLLERSRVVGGPENERNYHAFYQLLRSDDAKKYGLEPDPKKYEFTKVGADVPQPGVYETDDKSDYTALQARMGLAGFDDDLKSCIFECLAAVLHLGNVKCSGSKGNSSFDVDSSAMTEACKLLGVDKMKLAEAMTTKVMKVEGKELVSPVGPEEAEACKLSVAKLVYSAVFDEIVSIIDDKLSKGLSSSGSGNNGVVGMLDIFGFEDMATNGFEQMFINLTNERIQHLFNEIIFAREKKVYESDGILDLDFLTGPNNIKTVELFMGVGRNPGIIGYLSNQIKTGMDDDKIDGSNFVSLLNRTYDKHEKYTVCTPMELNRVLKKKGQTGKSGGMAADYRECFFIEHYAGQITYTVQNFVPKSRDSFPSHLGNVMRSSTKEHIRDFFPESSEGKGTVGEKFAVQLKDLAATLCAGETLFVRCIKSNQKKKPNLCDRVSVLEQLIFGGVVAALEMRAAGLPERMLVSEFLSEFGLLEKKVKGGGGEGERTKLRRRKTFDETVDKNRVNGLLEEFLGKDAMNRHEWCIGETKVFMKSHVLIFMESAKRMKIRFFARSMMKKLVGARVKKVDHAWEDILKAEELAVSKGLDSALVKGVVEKSKKAVEPLYKALLEARKKHGSGKEGFDKVMEDLKPHEAAMKTVRSSANESVDLVNALVARRKLVDNAIAQKCAKINAQAQELLERVAQVELDCEECADVASPEELATCRKACEGAKAKLSTLIKTTLPETKSKGPPNLDLEKGLPDKNFAKANEDWMQGLIEGGVFKLSKLLEEPIALVEESEHTSGAVLKVRREFQKAAKECEEAREASQARLEALQATAQQCIAVGFTEIIDVINAAVKADQKMSRLEDEAKDAAAFRAACAAYDAAVDDAVKAVEKGAVELERREKELRKRRILRLQLDSIGEAMTEGTDLPSTVATGEKVEEAQRQVADLQRELAELRQNENPDVEAWEASITALQDNSVAAVENFKKKVDEEREERRQKFKKLSSVFGGTISTKLDKSAPKATAAPAQKEDENDPEFIIKSLGLGDHRAHIMSIDQAISALKDAGVERSQVSACIAKLMKARFPIGGAKK